MVFCVRRFYIVLFFMWMINYKIGRIYALFIIQTVYFIYIREVKPHNDISFNRIEVVNELSTMGICYTMFIYTDYVSDVQIQYSCGWVVCVFLAIIVVYNFYCMFAAVFTNMRRSQIKKKHATAIRRKSMMTLRQGIVDELIQNLSSSNSDEEDKPLEVDPASNQG